MQHALLIKPNPNIPYFHHMKRLCQFELEIMFISLKQAYEDLEVHEVGHGAYFLFSTHQWTDQIEDHLSRLSFYYLYFEVKEHWFKPRSLANPLHFTPDLSNRLKYSGKTNETFTRLMLNIALYSSTHFTNQSDPLKSPYPTLNLLDPLCGRGTTLFEGLILGLKGYGVEQNKTAVSEGMLYLERYLKEGKYKHQVSKGKVVHNKKHLGDQIEINMGQNKKEVKQKQGPSIRMVRGDTLNTHLYYKKKSMDFIVSDLPYGVHHFSQSDQQHSRKLDRHSFLDQALTSWKQVIKPQGIMALSWNTFTLSRTDLSTLLTQHGFQVFEEETYLQFHHRVSQAIERDVIVACYKPTH